MSDSHFLTASQNGNSITAKERQLVGADCYYFRCYYYDGDDDDYYYYYSKSPSLSHSYSYPCSLVLVSVLL